MPQQPGSSFADDLADIRRSAGADDFTSDLASVRASAPTDERSTFARIVDAARTPLTTFPSRVGRAISDVWTDPSVENTTVGRVRDAMAQAVTPGFLAGHVTPAQVRGFIGGSAEGLGDVVSGMTSPLDLALLASGLKSVQQAGQGVGTFARAVNAVGSASLAARGAERMAEAHSAPAIGAGLLELAGGAAGLHGAAAPVQQPLRIVRAQLRAAPIAVTPTGDAVLPGNTIPMELTPDGSFVRSVPAEYPQREIRGLLPSGPDFIANDTGQIARLADADSFVRDLADVRGAAATPGKSSVQSIPARVMDREFDGAKIMNRIYSSDPTLTADAPKVQMTADEAAEMRRMLSEMETAPFTKRTFTPVDVGRGGAYEIAAGGAGAPVFHDITQGRSATRAAVTDAIAGMLEGQHSAMGQRALDVARARLGLNDLNVSRPLLPPEAGDLAQSGAMTDADHSQFDRFVDRLSAQDGDDRDYRSGVETLEREPGEEGIAMPQLLMHAGGAVLGGAVGAATGDTPEERIRRGLAGATAGAILPAAIPGLPRAAMIPAAEGAAEALDGRLSNVAPTTPNRPTYPNPMDAAYARVLESRGGQALDRVSAFPTTARQAPMPDHLHADPLAGTDVFLSKFPEEVRGGIQQILVDNGGFEAQRRGVVDAEQTARLAEGVAVDAARTLKAGTALNAQGVRAYANALAGAQTKINTLAQRVAGGQGTDADLVALEQARAEAKAIAASVMGGRAEAGRALAEFKVLARVMETGSPQQIQQVASGIRPEAQQFAQQFAQLPNDPLTRYRWLQQQGRAGITDRVRSYFYANILSGLKTHERNTIGNASNALLSLAAQPFGAAADVVRSAVTGAPRTVLFSELRPQAAGALVGIPQGLKELMFTLKNGVTRAQLSGALTAAEAGKLDIPAVEFQGGGANPFNWPMRGLDAADQFFRSIGRSQELYALAFQQAKREGLTGASLENRMAQLTTGTDEVSQGIQQQADRFARRNVFQEQPGAFAQGLRQLSAKFPPFSFVVPFIKTPANIIRQGFEYSPAGFVMSAPRSGGREGAQAMGRAVAGTAGVGYLAYLAATGQLSGSGPSDPAQRAQLMESGWRPNSVKIGNRWVGYMPIQPISTPASVVADAFDAWRDAGANAGTADKVADTVLRSVKSQLNQSFLSGLADLMTAIEEGENAKAKIGGAVGHIATGLVPFSGALRTVDAAMDPMVRQPQGIVESVKAALPGLSPSVPARLDRFGREIQREGGPVQRTADPFNTSTENTDPVVRELGRLGIKMSMPAGTMSFLSPDQKLAATEGMARLDPSSHQYAQLAALTSDTLSRDETRMLQRDKGGATYALLSRVLADPAYAALPDDRKAFVLRRAIERARSSMTQADKPVLLRGRILAVGAR